eukprot:121879-Prorocentrum_minimum.AAC.1
MASRANKVRSFVSPKSEAAVEQLAKLSKRFSGGHVGLPRDQPTPQVPTGADMATTGADMATT